MCNRRATAEFTRRAALVLRVGERMSKLGLVLPRYGAILTLLIAGACAGRTAVSKAPERGEVLRLLRVVQEGDTAARVEAAEDLRDYPGLADVIEPVLCAQLASAPSDVQMAIIVSLDHVGRTDAIRSLVSLVPGENRELAERADMAIEAIWGRIGAEAWPALPARLKTARGQILTAEGGKPVPNAEVRWVVDLRPSRTPQLSGRKVGRARTDDRGWFEMEAPRWPGMLSLWVRHDDAWSVLHGAEYPVINYLKRDEPWHLPVRDREIRLQVLDVAGAPVRDARAQLVFSEMGASTGDRAAAAADEHNMIRIGPIEHDNYWIDVTAPGRAPQRICAYQFDVDDRSDRAVRVTLAKGRLVVVNVAASGGPSAERWWVRFQFQTEWNNETREGWYVRTDPSGRAEFVCPIGKLATVKLETPGEAPQTKKLTVPAGASPVQLEMRASSSAIR